MGTNKRLNVGFDEIRSSAKSTNPAFQASPPSNQPKVLSNKFVERIFERMIMVNRT